MDYIDPVDLHGRMTTLAIGKKYLVKADISNCFPSIYSHSIDWALRTRPVAKADKGPGSTAWESQLDTYVRNCINGESKGLLIGPAVSNLLSELVLQSVDGELSSFSFVRFVDDYSAYFNTREEAEDFLVALQTSLGRFRLDLNTRKTKISSLREGTGDTWMAEVFSSLPSSPSDLSAVRFLQHAEVLAQRFPGHSVMKFAAKTLLRRTDRDGIGSVLVTRELVRLTSFHPQLLPTLSHEIEKLGRLAITQREELAEALREQLSRAIRSGETDSILWIVHILRRQLKRPTKLSKSDYMRLLQLEDDLVFVALAALDRAQAPKIARRVCNFTYSDESDRQEHWLARYEFWRRGWIPDGQLSGEELTWMRVLKKNSVVFCPTLG
jgi:hypothetical protein